MPIEQPFGREPDEEVPLREDLACDDAPDHQSMDWSSYFLAVDRSQTPYDDRDSAELIDDAVKSLALIRSPYGTGDPGAVLSVLVSLRAEINKRIDDAVADAWESGYSWDEIAERLAASSAGAARRRYGQHCKQRAEERPLPID
jgi:hypothetical protein